VQKNVQVPKDVQSQVRRLEELVISLMNKTNNNTFSTENSDQVTPNSSGSSDELVGTVEVEGEESGVGGNLTDTSVSLGKITIDEGNRANYVGSAHWTAILDNVYLSFFSVLKQLTG
jgi:hypothetical protein